VTAVAWTVVLLGGRRRRQEDADHPAASNAFV
jgi:hypothetical protein